MKYPVISTPRLEILQFTEKFISEKYISWLNDPDVVKYSNQRFSVHSSESSRKFLHTQINAGNYFWAICDRETHDHIGNITASINKYYGVADIGILIGEKKCWGFGYGEEAWKGVCEFLFNQVGIRKITAGTLACNRAMIKLANKAGMIEECRRKRQAVVDGEEVDVVYFGLFR